MTTQEEWSLAFARQAKADFEAYQGLKDVEFARNCHRFQLLQMACEKLAKAFLLRSGSDRKDLEESHVYIAAAIPTIVRQQYAQLHRGKNLKDRTDLTKRIGHLAREIEILSPSARAGGRRPDNCEYPWEDSSGRVMVPAEYTFPNLSTQLVQPAGVLLLRCVSAAIDALLTPI